MAGSVGKNVSMRLAHVAKLHRARAAALLADIGLYPGQETILKALVDENGRTMGELAAALSVRPPTVTKMVARLGAQGLVERRSAEGDARLARVFLTEAGMARAAALDAIWKELDKQILAGLDSKDAKRLRRLLRTVARNLSGDEPLPALDEREEAESAVEDG